MLLICRVLHKQKQEITDTLSTAENLDTSIVCHKFTHDVYRQAQLTAFYWLILKFSFGVKLKKYYTSIRKIWNSTWQFNNKNHKTLPSSALRYSFSSSVGLFVFIFGEVWWFDEEIFNSISKRINLQVSCLAVYVRKT